MKKETAMFKPVLDFFEEWYEFSAKEHLATGFAVVICSVMVFALGRIFFLFLNG